jgi:hypothetical protein
MYLHGIEINTIRELFLNDKSLNYNNIDTGTMSAIKKALKTYGYDLDAIVQAKGNPKTEEKQNNQQAI